MLGLIDYQKYCKKHGVPKVGENGNVVIPYDHTFSNPLYGSTENIPKEDSYIEISPDGTSVVFHIISEVPKWFCQIQNSSYFSRIPKNSAVSPFWIELTRRVYFECFGKYKDLLGGVDFWGELYPLYDYVENNYKPTPTFEWVLYKSASVENDNKQIYVLKSFPHFYHTNNVFCVIAEKQADTTYRYLVGNMNSKECFFLTLEDAACYMEAYILYFIERKNGFGLTSSIKSNALKNQISKFISKLK